MNRLHSSLTFASSLALLIGGSASELEDCRLYNPYLISRSLYSCAFLIQSLQFLCHPSRCSVHSISLAFFSPFFFSSARTSSRTAFTFSSEYRNGFDEIQTKLITPTYPCEPARHEAFHFQIVVKIHSFPLTRGTFASIHGS